MSRERAVAVAREGKTKATLVALPTEVGYDYRLELRNPAWLGCQNRRPVVEWYRRDTALVVLRVLAKALGFKLVPKDACEVCRKHKPLAAACRTCGFDGACKSCMRLHPCVR